jgi:hypothetical protein
LHSDLYSTLARTAGMASVYLFLVVMASVPFS